MSYQMNTQGNHCLYVPIA